MTREEKIETIYKKIWTTKSKRNDLAITATIECWINRAWPVMQAIVDKFDELCWPKIMIWDVLDWCEKNFEWNIKWNNPAFTTYNQEAHENYHEVILLWENKREALDNQPDECIDLIYSLIKD